MKYEEKNMKKFTISILILGMAICLAGCGDSTSGKTDATTENSKSIRTTDDDLKLSDYEKRVTDSLALTLTAYAHWDKNPNTVITCKDIKKWFAGKDTEDYGAALELAKGFCDETNDRTEFEGIRYYSVCGVEQFTTYLSDVYCVDETYLDNVPRKGTTDKYLLYNKENEMIYYHPGMVTGVSCYFEKAVENSDDATLCAYYKVSSDCDDLTAIDGTIELKFNYIECDSLIQFDSANFLINK